MFASPRAASFWPGLTATPRYSSPATPPSRTAGDASPIPPVNATASTPDIAATIAAIAARSR